MRFKRQQQQQQQQQSTADADGLDSCRRPPACRRMGSSPADGLGSFPSVMSGMSEGPLPAGVQPLCDSNGSSSSSSPPPMQTGLKVVDGPSPADGLGSHGSLYGGDVARVSSHGAPSSVCTGTGCTGSSSDGSAGRPFFQILALVLCTTNTVFAPLWTGL